MHVFVHFGAGAPSKKVLKGKLGTFPVLVIESSKEEKVFVSLNALLTEAFELVDSVVRVDEELRNYVYTRRV